MANTDLVTYGAPAETYFSVGEVGSATVPTAAAATLTGFESLKVDSAGWSPTATLNRGDAYVDWRGDKILEGSADPDAAFDVPVISQTALAEKIRFGNSSGTGENVTSSFGSDGNDAKYVVVVDEIWNDSNGLPTRLSRWVYPICAVKDVALGTHQRTSVIVDTVTFQPLADTTHKYFYHYTAAAGD